MRAFFLLLVLLVASGTSAQDLGETSFANSGEADAQEPFLRGLLLLHSFEYDDARDAFREAQEADAGFAMAYWGEAMTHNHPVWMRQDRDAALAVLARMEANVVEVTPRERDYLRALGFLFDTGEEEQYDKETRDDRYATAMRALAESYPDDLDARAFYALSILGTAHEGRDFTTYMKAAAVAEEVFDANPRHPGAAHYLIHAYDDPVHAPLGLRPARVYSDIAPAASHALHMPTHITLALGMWDEVAELNERSYDAARAASNRRGEELNGHGWHALWWWHYAATQLDDRPLADSLLAVARTAAEADFDGSTAQAHIGRIAAQHATAFGDGSVWNRVTESGRNSLSTRAQIDFARGFDAAMSGDLGRARQIADRLSEASGEDTAWSVRAAALALDGLVLIGEEQTEQGVERLREAAALEAEAPLMFGPPSPVIPAHEALGYALLASGDAAGAAEAFEVALSRAPNRRQSVRGLALARDAQ